MPTTFAVAKKSLQSRAAASFRPATAGRGTIGNSTHSLTSPESLDMIQGMIDEFKSDPSKGTQFLIDSGILTKSGNLSKRYGG